MQLVLMREAELRYFYPWLAEQLRGKARGAIAAPGVASAVRTPSIRWMIALPVCLMGPAALRRIHNKRDSDL